MASLEYEVTLIQQTLAHFIQVKLNLGPVGSI